MKIVSVTARNINHAVFATRRRLNLTCWEAPEIQRSGGEDGVYRIHLQGGVIIEAGIGPQFNKTEIHEVSDYQGD